MDQHEIVKHLIKQYPHFNDFPELIENIFIKHCKIYLSNFTSVISSPFCFQVGKRYNSVDDLFNNMKRSSHSIRSYAYNIYVTPDDKIPYIKFGRDSFGDYYDEVVSGFFNFYTTHPKIIKQLKNLNERVIYEEFITKVCKVIVGIFVFNMSLTKNSKIDFMNPARIATIMITSSNMTHCNDQIKEHPGFKYLDSLQNLNNASLIETLRNNKYVSCAMYIPYHNTSTTWFLGRLRKNEKLLTYFTALFSKEFNIVKVQEPAKYYEPKIWYEKVESIEI